MQKRKLDHMTPILREDLHWLPDVSAAEDRLQTHTLTYKFLRQTAPYLQELCVPVSVTCALMLVALYKFWRVTRAPP